LKLGRFVFAINIYALTSYYTTKGCGGVWGSRVDREGTEEAENSRPPPAFSGLPRGAAAHKRGT
jgi:hypothetical protein